MEKVYTTKPSPLRLHIFFFIRVSLRGSVCLLLKGAVAYKLFTKNSSKEEHSQVIESEIIFSDYIHIVQESCLIPFLQALFQKLLDLGFSHG